MPPLRTYGEGCGIAHALDLVGERWALLVVRELVLGPKRFTDLRGGLPNTSPNVLAQRLRELEQTGIVRRRRLPPPVGSSVYELTEWGRELEPIVRALGRWALRSAAFPEDAPVSVDSVALALTSLFDAETAEGFSAVLELRLGEDRFWVRIADGEIEVRRGEAEDPDAIIEADVEALRGVLWQGAELSDALREGDIRTAGDRRAVTRFVRLFAQPDPAARAAAG
jgi:DNA-binding HxlR family transcriptional regulator